jgi:hypothetical protein
MTKDTDSGCKRVGDALIDCRKKMSKMYLNDVRIDHEGGVEKGFLRGGRHGPCAHLERAYIRCVVNRECPEQGECLCLLGKIFLCLALGGHHVCELFVWFDLLVLLWRATCAVVLWLFVYNSAAATITKRKQMTIMQWKCWKLAWEGK